MPIYEYRCDQCDHKLEMLQKMSDDPATTCPECGEEGLRKLVSAAAFKLKGTGWYETDFKDKKPKKDAKSTDGKKTDAKSTGNDTKKTESNDKKTSSKPAASSSDSK